MASSQSKTCTTLLPLFASRAHLITRMLRFSPPLLPSLVIFQCTYLFDSKSNNPIGTIPLAQESRRLIFPRSNDSSATLLPWCWNPKVFRSFPRKSASFTSPVMANVLKGDQRLRVKLHGLLPKRLCELGISKTRLPGRW